jgi:beta-hydroxyacyl-ACP dehydratase FabZ
VKGPAFIVHRSSFIVRHIMMTIIEIMKILPHRYPMLLVDRIVEIDEGKRIVGLKNVSANEQFFQGHFPGAPVMPGVLIVEAMAQCGAILGLRDMPDRDRKLFLFGGVDKVRFRRPVVPGDQLRMECEVLHRRASSVKLKGTATVDGQLVAEAELLSILVDRPE